MGHQRAFHEQLPLCSNKRRMPIWRSNSLRFILPKHWPGSTRAFDRLRAIPSTTNAWPLSASRWPRRTASFTVTRSVSKYCVFLIICLNVKKSCHVVVLNCFGVCIVTVLHLYLSVPQCFLL